ncbi:MAG: PAS domain S-box protein [Desulfosporosinus sp.]|nr:PAS domain S-box protein [Desulfosporosinus sp.]
MAEDICQERFLLLPDIQKDLPPEETRKIFHELQVHQIELEMQNEELRRAQSELGIVKDQYFDLYNLAPVGYVTVSKSGLILKANLTAASMVGVSREILIKKPICQFLFKDDQDIYYLHCKRLLETGIPQIFELRIKNIDETVFWVRLNVAISFESAGRPMLMLVLIDISELKRTEEALNISEEKFRKLFEDGKTVSLIIDSDTGNIVDANRSAAEFYGWSIKELRQMCIQKINTLPPDKICNEMKETMAMNSMKFEFRHRKADGSIIDVEVFSSRISIAGKDLLYSIIHDISDRKMVEKALQENEEKYRKVFENHVTAICIFDLETFQLIDANKTHLQLYGYSREEMLAGMKVYDLSADKEASLVSLRIAQSKGGIFVPLRYHKKKDGTIFPVEIVEEPFLLQGRCLMFGMVRDITRRSIIEKQLQDSQIFNLAILNSLSDEIVVLDHNGIILAVNESWTRFALENSREPGIPVPNTGVGADYMWVCRVATGLESDDALKTLNGIQSVLDGQISRFSLEYSCNSPFQVRWFTMNVTPLGPDNRGVVVVHTDITERKIAEVKLQQSEERLKAAAKAAGFGVYSYDFCLGEAYYSPEFLALFGLASTSTLELDTDLVVKAIHPKDKSEFLACINIAKDPNGSGMLDHECRIIRSDSQVRWLRVIGQTIFSGKQSFGQPLYINGIILDITERKMAEEALMKAHDELERRVLDRTADLEKTNATLAMMLDYARKAEADIQERVVANLRTNSFQILDLLKKQQLTKGAHELVELLESNTQNLAHPLARRLESPFFRLTTREMQVANFIRQGKSTKDIMRLLNLSYQTVESHRNNLRKKLGLCHKKINLQTFLNSEFAE